jgi:hypothetical protein
VKLVSFLQTVSATAAFAAGLLFLRFWPETGLRLFVFFSAAFWLMALAWTLLALVSPERRNAAADLHRPIIRRCSFDRRHVQQGENEYSKQQKA